MESKEIERLFQSFNKLKVMIIGDVMIDAYYWGKVERISPEAPVPIVAIEKKEMRLGGAANVALNVQALGATPILCSVIGNGEEAEEFMQLMDDVKLTKHGINRSKSRLTTKKTRIIGNQHQMMRIDSEITDPILPKEEKQFYDTIASIVKSEDIDVIIFEDYDKGCITSGVIKEVVQLAKKNGIPTTVDPKKNQFLDYKEVSLFKPNLKELREGLKIDFDHLQAEQLADATYQLAKELGNELTMITLSEHGVYIQSDQERHHIPAHRRDITDVLGAGDTVISVASLCLAMKQNPKVIAEISNLAGGLVCEKVGVVPIDKVQLLQESLRTLAKA